MARRHDHKWAGEPDTLFLSGGEGEAVPDVLFDPDGPGLRDPRALFRRALTLALAQRRGFLLVPFALIAGILFYRLPRFEPQLWAPMALLGLAGLAFGGALARQRAMLGTGLALAFAAGFAGTGLHARVFGTQMLQKPVYGYYIADIDKVLPGEGPEQRVILSRISALQGLTPRVRRARLFVRTGPKLAPGMRIEGYMRFDQVPGPAAPGGFDTQFASFFDGIGSYAITTRPPKVIRKPISTMIGGIDRVRSGIGRRINADLPKREAGIARALIIGDQSGISPETRSDLARAGLAHVLAISGLHLSLVAGGAFWLLRLLLALSQGFAARVPTKKLAALGGIGVALGYLALSGGSVSAERATITLILVFGAILAGRRALTMRNVALAALAVLALAPQSLFRPGFQLSFAAVTALVGVYELIGSRHTPIGWLSRLTRYAGGLALTSLVAGAATAIFAAYHFQQTAPLGLLGNVLAVPLVGLVILPAGAAAVLLMPFGASAPLLSLMGWGIDAVLAVAGFVAHLSAPLQITPLLNANALLIALLGLAWFAFFAGRERLLGPALAVPLIFWLGTMPGPDILIADRTKGLAVRTEHGFALMTGRTYSFAVEVWEQSYGVDIAAKSPDIACTKTICTTHLFDGAAVSLVMDSQGFAAACTGADLVVTRIDAPKSCRTETKVIDARDLARNGTYWGRWDGASKTFDLRPAITDPDRPWRPGG